MTKLSASTLNPKCPPNLRELLRLVDYDYTVCAKHTGYKRESFAKVARGAQAMGPQMAKAVDDLIVKLNNGGSGPQTAASVPPAFQPPEKLKELLHAVGNPARLAWVLDEDP